MSDEEIEAASVRDQAMAAKTKAAARLKPVLCSNCLAGNQPRPLYVTQQGEPEILLCSLRCMAMWAQAKGWTI